MMNGNWSPSRWTNLETIVLPEFWQLRSRLEDWLDEFYRLEPFSNCRENESEM